MPRPGSIHLSAVVSLALMLVAGCGGGGSKSAPPSGGSSSSNPTPSITTITPNSVVAGSSSQTLAVTGSGFINASVVNLNGKALTTTYGSGTSLQAAIPAQAISADGTATVTVTNPSPGGGTSTSQIYTITVPTPAVTSLSPQSVTQGVPATITISGSGFEANSVAQWNGNTRPTTFVNSTTIQVALTAADVQNFGTGQIAVVNPNITPTTPLDLLVVANTPTITGVSPNSVAVYTNSNVPQQIYISGSGFAPNATVQVNGQLVSPVSQSQTSVIVSLAASYFSKQGTIQFVVSNPGTPVISSNPGTLTVTAPSAPSFSISPNSAPAGSPDTTITLQGSGFYADSVVTWNGTPLKTTYVGSYSVTAVVPASLLAGFVQASIGVNTPENTQSPAPQPFDTFLQLPINDIVYNAKDGLLYASVAGVAGPNLGNSIAAIDPTTGVVSKTIFVGSEPNRLALSTDGTQIFAGLDAVGAVRQVDLTTDTAGVQFSLGGGPGLYNPPYKAVSLVAVPGEANSVAVYASNGIVTIFDSGVARANTSSNLPTYFVQNTGGLAFGSSASVLYVSPNAIGGYLYKLAVNSTGITGATQLPANGSGNTLQYDNGELYFPTGVAVDATTGNQVGQFSLVSSFNSQPTAANGPIVSDSTLNTAWILSSSYNYQGYSLTSFDEKTFDPVQSIQVTGVGSVPSNTYNTNPFDLIRWGQNGLAFHTANQLYVVQGPIVKDESTSPADLTVSIQAPASATTGSTLTYTIKVQNFGPNAAQGVTVQGFLPGSVIFGSLNAAQGTCAGMGAFYCDLGSIASGSSTTVTLAVTPTTAATLGLTANVASSSYDPISTNNQATATTAATGADFNAAPVVTQLSPSNIQAGSNTFTLTVNGEGFVPGSAILWNGSALSTTLLSTGQLTASVDASMVKNLGWSSVSVSTPAPGGGQSMALPFSIYQVLNVPANTVSYDPFTRKLYAVLPSTAQGITGNSIVAIDPAAASVGNPIVIGSEPNLLSETSDGNYLYVGLSGAKSLGRFNLLNQALDQTVPLPAGPNFGGTSGTVAAVSIATVPGSDASLAVELGSYGGINILDIANGAGTFRSKGSGIYNGDNPVFADATHFYAYDAETSGSEFYRYSIDASGVTQIDGTTLNGMGGFGGLFAVDGGLVYGAGGGIVNPSTTPPSQLGVLPLPYGSYASQSFAGGTVPYASEAKSFNILSGNAYSVARYDAQHYVLEETMQLPIAANLSGPNNGFLGTRWGQDGLAYVVPVTNSSNSNNNQQSTEIFLVRGPFVLPSEIASNPAPALSSTDHNTISAGSGNVYVKVSGSGFLPGATVLWNGSPRTTNYVDGSHLSVAVSAADVKSAATIPLTAENPGSGASNSINVTVQ